MLINEILKNLRRPIAPQFISQKTLKGNRIDYVAWYDLCDLLDDLCDSWEWEIKDVQQVGENLTLIGSLTIHGEDKSVTRMATGIEELTCSSYGDPSSNAEAMALRRACAKFGLGRDLWRKEREYPERRSYESEQRPRQATGTISKEEWLKRKMKA